MLLGSGFADCGIDVSESLLRVPKAEVSKTEEAKTHNVRIETRLLNEVTVDVGNVEMVEFSEMRAGRTKIPAQQSRTPLPEMAEDQAPRIAAFLPAPHQIVGKTSRQIQVPPIEMVHPLTPRDANELRGIAQLFP